jgi:hypothetical protein
VKQTKKKRENKTDTEQNAPALRQQRYTEKRVSQFSRARRQKRKKGVECHTYNNENEKRQEYLRKENTHRKR